jgi:hypothetical protein
MVKEKYLPYIEPEKDPEPVKTPQQIRKEKIKNFFDYHKWHVLLVVGLIVAVVWTVVDAVNRVEPDYIIPYISQNDLPVSIEEDLEDFLEVYADDRNGDGKVTVAVEKFALNSAAMNEEPEKAQTEVLRFLGNSQTNINAFYIGDEVNIMEFAGYEELIGYTDGSEIKEGDKFTIEDVGILMRGTKLVPEDYEYAVAFNGFYFAVRANEGDIIENKQETYDAGFAFLQRILKDEKVNP